MLLWLSVLMTASVARAECPVFKFDGKNEYAFCVEKNGSIEKVIAHSASEMQDITGDFLYKPFARFAAQGLWESYARSFLNDQIWTKNDCSSGRERVIARAKQAILVDTFLGTGNGGPATDWPRELKACDAKLGGGGWFEKRANDLAGSVADMLCEKQPQGVKNGSCKDGDTNFKNFKAAQSDYYKTLGKRVQNLKDIQDNRAKLFEGKLSDANGPIESRGKRYHAGKLYDQVTCADSLRWMIKNCVDAYDAKAYSSQCPEPGENEMRAWKAWTSLRRTEQEIFNRYPELRTSWADIYNRTFPMGRKECKSLGGLFANKIDCDSLRDEMYDTAIKNNRAAKLKQFYGDFCENMDDIAKDLIRYSPDATATFLKQPGNEDLSKIACFARQEIKNEDRNKKIGEAALGIGAAIVGVGASFATGGTSLSLLAISAGTGHALAFKNVYDAHAGLNRAKGLNSSCSGDYLRIGKALASVEDAEFALGVGLALDVGVAGVGAAAKAYEIRAIAKARNIAFEEQTARDLALVAKQEKVAQAEVKAETTIESKATDSFDDWGDLNEPLALGQTETGPAPAHLQIKPPKSTKLTKFDGEWAAGTLERGTVYTDVTLTKAASGEMSGNVFIMEKNGVKKVFRVVDGLEATDDGVTASRRALAASKLNHDVFALKTVPKAEMATVNGKRGVVSEFASGTLAHDSGMLTSDALYAKNAKAAADADAFEFVVGNMDATPKNFNVTKNGEVFVFDHNKAFEDSFVGSAWGVLGKQPPEKVTRHFYDKLKTMKELNSNELISVLGGNLTKEEADGVVGRAKMLWELLEANKKSGVDIFID